MNGQTVVGGALFGKPAAFNVECKYATAGKLVELRRFVLEDWLPKNSESRYLAVALRDLKRRGVCHVLSYADPAHGHDGTIYRALGFAYLGKTSRRKHVLWRGKKYPDRNIHQIHFPYHVELRAALQSGEAKKVGVPGKHIYLKTFST